MNAKNKLIRLGERELKRRHGSLKVAAELHGISESTLKIWLQVREPSPGASLRGQPATKKPNEITHYAADVYRWIWKFREEHGYPPSVREIGAQMLVSSTNAVCEMLGRLESAGYIASPPKKPGAHRGRVQARAYKLLIHPDLIPQDLKNGPK